MEARGGSLRSATVRQGLLKFAEVRPGSLRFPEFFAISRSSLRLVREGSARFASKRKVR